MINEKRFDLAMRAAKMLWARQSIEDSRAEVVAVLEIGWPALQMQGEHADRNITLLELVGTHYAAGALTLRAVFDAFTADDWDRLEELLGPDAEDG